MYKSCFRCARKLGVQKCAYEHGFCLSDLRRAAVGEMIGEQKETFGLRPEVPDIVKGESLHPGGRYKDS